MKNLRIVSAPEEIRTEHTPNASPECYHYVNPLGCVVNNEPEMVWKAVVVA
jgi:hypothetical protein